MTLHLLFPRGMNHFSVSLAPSGLWHCHSKIRLRGCNSAPHDVDRSFAGNIMASFHVKSSNKDSNAKKVKKWLKKRLETEMLRRISGLCERPLASSQNVAQEAKKPLFYWHYVCWTTKLLLKQLCRWQKSQDILQINMESYGRCFASGPGLDPDWFRSMGPGPILGIQIRIQDCCSIRLNSQSW